MTNESRKFGDYRDSAAMQRGPTARLKLDGKPAWPMRVGTIDSQAKEKK